MKKYTYILLGILASFFSQSCSEETPVNKLLKDVANGGALRNIKATNDLDQSDMTTTYTVFLEAQTADNGRSLKEVNVFVGFTDENSVGASSVVINEKGRYDVKGLPIFRTIPAAEFNEESTTTNKLPVGKFTATLQQMADFLNMTQGDFSHEDKFVVGFQMVLTDGRTYNWLDASADITRTGRFSYFNSQFFYELSLDARVTKVTSSSSSSPVRLHSGETTAVSWAINGGNGKELLQNFRVTRLSVTGDSTDQLGPVTKVDDMGQAYYRMLYTPSDVDADTISFVLSHAALYAGVPMAPYTLNKVFIIDNKLDFKCEPPLVLFDGGKNTIENLTLTLDFGEPLMTGDTLVISVASDDFDNFVEQRIIGANDASFVLNFTPLSSGEKIAPVDFIMQVSADGVMNSERGARDRARNRINNITKSVSVTF